MGITGLLNFVTNAIDPINLSSLHGKRVAVDSYCWLHRGAFSCAEKLAIGEFTDAHIRYCLKYVNLLLHHKITPIMVFDGRHLPAKKDEELTRRENRKNKKITAAKLLKKGDKAKARSYIASSVDITHKMALDLIEACRKIHVDSIVAPYEADAQLAYLNVNGYVDYVITEDSDLILFGCKRILYKLQITGDAMCYNRDKLPECFTSETFDFAAFRAICVLSGCDYLPSLPGVGLVKAKKFVTKCSPASVVESLPDLPKYLNMPKLEVPEEYIRNYQMAEATFLYQWTFDPKLRKLKRLNDVPENFDENHLERAGEWFDDAFEHALGNVDPFTQKRVASWNPDGDRDLKASSIWKHGQTGILGFVKRRVKEEAVKVRTSKVGLDETEILKLLNEHENSKKRKRDESDEDVSNSPEKFQKVSKLKTPEKFQRKSVLEMLNDVQTKKEIEKNQNPFSLDTKTESLSTSLHEELTKIGSKIDDKVDQNTQISPIVQKRRGKRFLAGNRPSNAQQLSSFFVSKSVSQNVTSTAISLTSSQKENTSQNEDEIDFSKDSIEIINVDELNEVEKVTEIESKAKHTPVFNYTNSFAQKTPQKSVKTVVNRVGLSRKGKMNRKDTVPGQSMLSMYGFQRTKSQTQ